MIILRMQGCDVGCAFCDTKESWNLDEDMRAPTIEDASGKSPYWALATIDEIVDAVLRVTGDSRIDWVLLTGGEPSMYSIVPLVNALQNTFLVALETSGTQYGHIGENGQPCTDWTTVSPKQAKKPLIANVLTTASEIKFVIGTLSDINAAHAVLDAYDLKFNPDVVVCLQPVSNAFKPLALCLDECKQWGWRLSVQVHKLIDIP